MNLTWWEAEELVTHLESRPDVWTKSDDVWSSVVDVDPPTTLLIRLTSPGDSTSPFRMYNLIAVCHEWHQDNTDIFVHRFVDLWTTHARRVAVTTFLVDDLRIDPKIAELGAIAIESFDWADGKLEPPVAPITQQPLFPPPQEARSASVDPLDLGTFLLSSGSGWLRLRHAGGMLRTIISIRAKNGVAHLLEGFVRPRDSSLDAFTSAMKGEE